MRGEMQGETGWATYEQKQFQQESEDVYDSDENYHTYGNMRSDVHDIRKKLVIIKEKFIIPKRAVRTTSHRQKLLIEMISCHQAS